MAYQIEVGQGKQAKYLHRVFKQSLIPHLLIMPQVFYYQESMFTFGTYLALIMIVRHIFWSELIMPASFAVDTPLDASGFVFLLLLLTGISSISINSLLFSMY